MATAKVAVLVGREPMHRYSVHRGYVDALWAAGATPILLAPPPDTATVDRYVEAALDCDAVCVTGGGDVDPAWYAAPPEDGLMDVDPLRDGCEVAAVRAAVAGGQPLLGVCRGIQLVTVAFGGSLHQDLTRAGFRGHWAIESEYQPVHGLDVEPGSAALAALGGANRVNSIHHQAVADPGEQLTATAWSPDGVIEAVEAPGVLGLQWHPERLWPADERHLAPFRWLVSA
ncbi:MAG TPA: gamma-glutamyl-gamma-aminobutyrate hydrolase family protein [Acidimicrobiales bacterium]|jgi:putative glutamine amidotransferase